MAHVLSNSTDSQISLKYSPTGQTYIANNQAINLLLDEMNCYKNHEDVLPKSLQMNELPRLGEREKCYHLMPRKWGM